MTTAHETAAAVPQQGSHHYVLTLDLPGQAMFTWDGTLTPGTRDTRYDVYVWLKRQIVAARPELADANVTFFALEPNSL
ncbi:hypothetical protein [Streptomyces clavuligerus]|uniref:Uncharacterized protein n=1 Tax=Streptomyces clavuligerus TaxID=1901 RepID=B5GL87_STRCL|nr:hypothetical protein [Streptomyces clavuligerus]ANW18105.1 hypothetical protein BB341_07645 [Streptomyces clavuligerus]AXU12666.1 hypothetical protein D1794_07930 [Streptomyces clavuligerus]EDY47083.1 hypothetical protein SSCG_00111 [Streptomyces clavuligerus]EFG09308.1 Hypothetical protein SCLAV_4234 [Streptomyces clavuligerus]MBY6302569.1 hypothetical protein [Streptomyces clavuligerus]